jgi:hypothetical protein
VVLVFTVWDTTADTIARMFFTRWSSSPSSKLVFCSAALRALAVDGTGSGETVERPDAGRKAVQTGEVSR